MKLVKIAIVIWMLTGLQAKASDDVGLGGILGSPTGLSGHLKLDNEHMVAGALAYNLSRFQGLHVSSDYLWTNNYDFRIKSWAWDVYYGLGGRIIAVQTGDDKSKTAFGVRGPIGATHVLSDPHIMLFGEIVPVLNLSPTSDFGFDLGVGFRILF